MAEKREFSFLSADGKTQIRAIEWQPDGKPKGIKPDFSVFTAEPLGLVFQALGNVENFSRSQG